MRLCFLRRHQTVCSAQQHSSRLRLPCRLLADLMSHCGQQLPKLWPAKAQVNPMGLAYKPTVHAVGICHRVFCLYSCLFAH